MIAVVALLAAATTAAAAPENKSDMSVKETRKVLADYGECIVKRQARRASEAIMLNVDNSTLLKKYPRLIDGSCLPVTQGSVVEVSFHGDQYRYALADALVRTELAALPAPDLEQVPLLDHHDPGEPPSRIAENGKPLKEKDYQEALSEFQEARAFSFLSRYGECVVRLDPAAARALLLTEPETPEESAQFGAMRTALGNCLPEGETVALGKLALRGTIAINYYRLAKAAQRTMVAGEAG